MGRSKIPITWIKSDASRQVTFNKRKKGMKKKAEELAILCGVDVCMICYGPSIVGGATTNSSSSNKQPGQSPFKQQNQSAASASSSSVPFSWGMPGVSSVITKFEGLPREERDKKKLDNTSLLEQQIKKLRRELKTKLDANWKLEQERAMLAWDDRLDCYSIDELKRLADCLLDKLRATFERISCWEQCGGGEDELVAAAAAAASGNPGGGALIPSGSPSFLPYLSVNSMLLPPPQSQPQPLGDGTTPPPPPADGAVFPQQGFYDTGFLGASQPPPQLLWTSNADFNGCRLSRNLAEIGGTGDESWASPVGAEMSTGDGGREPQEEEQRPIAFRGYDDA